MQNGLIKEISTGTMVGVIFNAKNYAFNRFHRIYHVSTFYVYTACYLI
ncbi:hypothetical protein LP2241_30034 [Pseudolactococcus piscium]|nr:hypothetical protein LP2241_30034 [Lactococcus piscium]